MYDTDSTEFRIRIRMNIGFWIHVLYCIKLNMNPLTKQLEPNKLSLIWNTIPSNALKVHKIENFFGSEFEFYTISLLVMLKY